MDNFIEMRSKVGNRRFLLMKQVENMLENMFHTLFRSRYAMVCYGGDGNITYQNAKTLGDVQWEIIEELSRNLDKAENVNLQNALEMMEQSLVVLQKLLNIDLSR